MQITPEERHYIYLEEKARMEAQQELFAEQTLPYSGTQDPYLPPSARRNTDYWGWSLSLIFILVVVGFIFRQSPMNHPVDVLTRPVDGSALIPSTTAADSSNPIMPVDDTRDAANIPVPLALPDLQVLESHSESDDYSSYAAGTVRNNTTHNFHYVRVKINLYDATGNPVGSTDATTSDLAAGQTWKFRVIALSETAKKWKVKDVTGF